MSKFEDHLWRAVTREHGDDLAQISRPAAERRQRPPAVLMAGTGLGVAGVIAALAFVLGGASTTPAFAVTRHHDGTVTVSIRRASGIAGANAKLRRLGIRAQVTRQVPARCGDGPPPPAPPDTGGIAAAHWTIDPSKVPMGRTLALTPPGVHSHSNGGNIAGNGTATASQTTTNAGNGTATGTQTSTDAGNATATGSQTTANAGNAPGGGVWSCVQ